MGWHMRIQRGIGCSDPHHTVQSHSCSIDGVFSTDGSGGGRFFV